MTCGNSSRSPACATTSASCAPRRLRTAQLLNRADLARDVGISGSTAGAWLSGLEAFASARAAGAVVREPDQGARQAAEALPARRGARDVPVWRAHDAGACTRRPSLVHCGETLVCAEIRRAQSNRRGGWDLNFWRDRTREADFLLHRAGTFHLADAKWTEHPGGRDAEVLRKVARELPAGAVQVDVDLLPGAEWPIPSVQVTCTPFRSPCRQSSRVGSRHCSPPLLSRGIDIERSADPGRVSDLS